MNNAYFIYPLWTRFLGQPPYLDWLCLKIVASPTLLQVECHRKKWHVSPSVPLASWQVSICSCCETTPLKHIHLQTKWGLNKNKTTWNQKSPEINYLKPKKSKKIKLLQLFPILPRWFSSFSMRDTPPRLSGISSCPWDYPARNRQHNDTQRNRGAPRGKMVRKYVHPFGKSLLGCPRKLVKG